MLLPAATTGELYIARQYPEGVRILVDEVLKETNTPGFIPGLEPGRRVVEIRHELYQTIIDTITVEGGLRHTINTPMIRRMGLLALESEPSGATVKIDGDEAATNHVDTTVTTPSGDLELPTGRYQLHPNLKGHLGASDRVLIAESAPQMKRFELVANVGELFVTTVPETVSVYVDGEERGMTPILISGLSVGPHKVELKKRQYVQSARSRSIQLGEIDSLNVTMQLQPAIVDLTTVPPGATVLVDGNQQTVPLSLTPGAHRITIRHEGFDEKTIDCVLSPGQDTSATVVLNQQFGHVRIAYPRTGTLYVDGIESRRGPLGDIKLSVGVHKLRIDGEEEIKEVHVSKDSTSKLSWRK